MRTNEDERLESTTDRSNSRSRFNQHRRDRLVSKNLFKELQDDQRLIACKVEERQ